jgi:hypothetical protein
LKLLKKLRIYTIHHKILDTKDHGLGCQSEGPFSDRRPLQAV